MGVDVLFEYTNAKPVRIKLSVTWTGKWEQRQTDMKKFLTVKIEKYEKSVSCNS